MEKQNYAFARLISYLFHPLFMPTLGLLFIYFSNKINHFNLYVTPSAHDKNIFIMAITFFFSLVIPAVFVFVLKKAKRIESYHMHQKEERLLPFSFMAMSIFCAYYLLFDYYLIQVEPIIKVFYFGCLLSIIGALIITTKWKISIHMIGIGGFTGAIFLLSYLSKTDNLLILAGSIIAAGLIAYSRLSLKAHSLKQVVAGFILGFVSETFFLFLI
jgi:membrane-associated phospholipid phosphatase